MWSGGLQVCQLWVLPIWFLFHSQRIVRIWHGFAGPIDGSFAQYNSRKYWYFRITFFLYIICLVVIFFRFPKMRQSISSAYLQGSSMSFRSVSSYGTDLQWSIRL